MDNIISTKNEERLVGGDGPDNASEKWYRLVDLSLQHARSGHVFNTQFVWISKNDERLKFENQIKHPKTWPDRCQLDVTLLSTNTLKSVFRRLVAFSNPSTPIRSTRHCKCAFRLQKQLTVCNVPSITLYKTISCLHRGRKAAAEMWNYIDIIFIDRCSGIVDDVLRMRW